MQNHRSIRAFQASVRLAAEVYAVARMLPGEERFALASQLRRGAVAVGSNIVEGCGRHTPRDLCSFLDRSLGATRELEFQLQHCQNTGLASGAETRRALTTCTCVQKLLTALILKIRRENGL